MARTRYPDDAIILIARPPCAPCHSPIPWADRGFPARQRSTRYVLFNDVLRVSLAFILDSPSDTRLSGLNAAPRPDRPPWIAWRRDAAAGLALRRWQRDRDATG